MSDVTKAIKDNISITAYAGMQGYHVKEVVPDRRWTVEEHDSLVITPDPKHSGRQRFFWNSRQLSGSVIDFAMATKGLNMDEAISELRLILGEKSIEEWTQVRQAQFAQARPRANQAGLALPPKGNNGMSRVFAYLCKSRGLESAIVSDLAQQKILYQDERGNAVFVGCDYNGEAKYSCTRGTLTQVSYRKEALGSKKEIGFSMNLVGEEPTRLVVCEAPIDAISFASMMQLCGKDYTGLAYLSLGGTSINALKYHLAHQPQLQTIYLCQDNDAAGHKSRELCRQHLTQQGFAGKVIDKLPIGKDFNEDLLQMRIEKGLQQFRIKQPLAPALQQPGALS